MDQVEEFFQFRARRLHELTAQLLRRTAQRKEQARRRSASHDERRLPAAREERRPETRQWRGHLQGTRTAP